MVTITGVVGLDTGEEGGVLRLFLDGDRSLLMAGDKGG